VVALLLVTAIGVAYLASVVYRERSAESQRKKLLELNAGISLTQNRLQEVIEEQRALRAGDESKGHLNKRVVTSEQYLAMSAAERRLLENENRSAARRRLTEIDAEIPRLQKDLKGLQSELARFGSASDK
jgi:hypothetical protein